MNQSQFYDTKSAANNLSQRLCIHPNNILFNYDTGVTTEGGYVPQELIERIINTTYYYLNIYNNCCLVGVHFNNPLYASLYFDGEMRGKQDVFINYFELYKNWFESQDKLEELSSFTKTSEYKTLSDKDRKIKALESRIEELLLEKNDINEYSIQQEAENKSLKNDVENLKTMNRDMNRSLELDQAELKKALKCCIKYDKQVSQLKQDLANEQANNTSQGVANSCMDYRSDYEALLKKIEQVKAIVFEQDTIVETVVNDTSSNQKSKITDYYKPISHQKPPLAPQKPQRLSLTIRDRVNHRYMEYPKTPRVKPRVDYSKSENLYYGC